jgi:hypothetical protein
MTKEQFLEVYNRHLNIGGRKRDEVVAEVASHLQEESADKLGDPVLLARNTNRVHLGFFASFRSLAIAAVITTVIFDVFIPYTAVKYNVNGGTSASLQLFWSLAPFVSPLLFIYGAHAISRMRNRWVSIMMLAAIFAGGFVIQQELMQAIGYLLISTVSGGSLLWEAHIQPVITFLLTYAIIGYGVMVVTAGRQRIVSHHQVIDVALAFIIEAAAARYLLPMIWNAITTFHYTMAMSEWAASAFPYLTAASIIIGLLGAGIEWLRIRAVKKHATAT